MKTQRYIQLKATQMDLDNLKEAREKHNHETDSSTIRAALRLYSIAKPMHL